MRSRFIFPFTEIPALVSILILGIAIIGFSVRSERTSTLYSVPGRYSWKIIFLNLLNTYSRSNLFSIFIILVLPLPKRGLAIKGNVFDKNLYDNSLSLQISNTFLLLTIGIAPYSTIKS